MKLRCGAFMVRVTVGAVAGPGLDLQSAVLIRGCRVVRDADEPARCHCVLAVTLVGSLTGRGPSRPSLLQAARQPHGGSFARWSGYAGSSGLKAAPSGQRGPAGADGPSRELFHAFVPGHRDSVWAMEAHTKRCFRRDFPAAPSRRESLHWSRRCESDPAHHWIRNLFVDLFDDKNRADRP